MPYLRLGQPPSSGSLVLPMGRVDVSRIKVGQAGLIAG